jgi:hypothetical protein
MSKAASLALYRTRDSGTRPPEVSGFEAQDSSLAWGCRSDCPKQVPTLPAIPRRSAIPCDDVTEVPSKALLLHHPVVAAARRECGLAVQRLQRSVRSAASRFCGRSRETPTDRPRARESYRGKRCCPACVDPSGAAKRSGSQILLAAWCLDSETGGRTNRDQYPDVFPWSR